MSLSKRVPPSLWVCAAMFVLCWVAVPRFGTAGNFFNLSRVASILLLASLGQSFVMVVRGIDFSAGSGVALFSVVAVLAASSLGTASAFALGTLAVLMLGMINGLLVGTLNVPPFLATLGSMIAVHGLSGALVGGMPLDAPAGVDFSALAQSAWLSLPAPLWVAAGAFAVVGFTMQFTRFGREWVAIGSSPDAARLAGVPVKRRVVQAYLCNVLLIAAAAAILTSRLGSGQPNLYPSLSFEAIAACSIGGISLSGGKGNALHALIGVLILSMIVNALVLINFPSLVQNMVLGVVIVGAVLIQQMRGRPARRLVTTLQ
jgi:ribose transport system permease protein